MSEAVSVNVDTKERFAFGKNWSKFLSAFNEERLLEAEKSLQEKLGVVDLKGKTFLDIGSGSGLFSLAAHRLGARVYSFDYDTDSVNCTQYLKDKYGTNTVEWSVEQGSVLDEQFLKRFKTVDIVYSWGVLHHTGNMLKAFENVSSLANPEGKLFISIYNDQGSASRRWLAIKKLYNKSPSVLRFFLVLACLVRLWAITVIKDTFSSLNPLKNWHHYNYRGMSPWYDVVDWVGGYPFEVATPELVFDFFKRKGFQLEKLKTCAGGLGCNEFVFIRKN